MPPSKPRQQRTSHQGMFAPLLRYVEKTNPTEFRLPDDIRTNFANGMPFEEPGHSFVKGPGSLACFVFCLSSNGIQWSVRRQLRAKASEI
jgi:hypothetical protein